MKNYYVYAIKSEKDNRIYVGLSSNAERRLQEHNAGGTKSTKAWRPWRIIYKKIAGSRIQARELEKKLKSGYGKEYLKNIE